MLCVVLSIVIGSIYAIFKKIKMTDFSFEDGCAWDWIGATIFSYILIELFVVILLLFGVGTRVTENHEIKNFGNYYTISGEDAVSVVMVDENGDGIPKSFDKNTVEFKEGDSANIEITYAKQKRWMTMFPKRYEVKTIITLPTIE